MILHSQLKIFNTKHFFISGCFLYFNPKTHPHKTFYINLFTHPTTLNLPLPHPPKKHFIPPRKGPQTRQTVQTYFPPTISEKNTKYTKKSNQKTQNTQQKKTPQNTQQKNNHPTRICTTAQCFLCPCLQRFFLSSKRRIWENGARHLFPLGAAGGPQCRGGRDYRAEAAWPWGGGVDPGIPCHLITLGDAFLF